MFSSEGRGSLLCHSLWGPKGQTRLGDWATVTFGNLGPSTFSLLSDCLEVVKFCLFQKLVFDFFDFLINCIGLYFSLLFLEIVKYTFELKWVNFCNQLHECWIFFFHLVLLNKKHSSSKGTVKVQCNYSSSSFSAFV